MSKLPVTRRLLREVGLLQQVTAEYARLLTTRVTNGHGRSPRKLAEESLIEACERAVPSSLGRAVIRKHHLTRTGMKSLVVLSELAAWRG